MTSPGEEEPLLAAARAARSYLPDLVGEPHATELDAELAQLLTRARDGQTVTEQLSQVLSRVPGLLTWVAGFLEYGCPPDMAPLRERTFQGLPGLPEAPSADRFHCPEGDFVFYRRSVGVHVPVCPTHSLPLER